MNPKNNTSRDAGFRRVKNLLATAALSAAALMLGSNVTFGASGQWTAAQGLYIDGQYDQIINAGGTAFTNNVLLPGTNYFNLNGVNGSQANTNQWPTLGFTVGRGEGTGSRIIALQDQFAPMAASGLDVFTIRYAGSVDGAHWQTNPCPVIWVQTAATTGLTGNITNVDTGGWPFLTVYSMENTNATVALTNVWHGVGQKLYQ